MSDESEVKEQQQDPAQLISELEAKITALEQRKAKPKTESLEVKVRELTRKLEALEKSEELQEVEATVEDALSREQQIESYYQKKESRERNIERIEKEILEDSRILKNLLAKDDYPQYFFSSLRTDQRTEKIRRFCYHINRMGGEKFIEGYRKFILEDYNQD